LSNLTELSVAQLDVRVGHDTNDGAYIERV